MSAEPLASLTSLISVIFALLTFGCSSEDSAVSADGVRIAYQVRGHGEPALVFVHGWCCDKSYWEAQAAHFSGKHRVVAVDLANHDDSGLDRAEWSIAAFGEDVAAVVDKLGLERVVLVGHSMGGPVCLEAARRLPGRVICLVGADTFKIIEPQFTREQAEGWIASFRENFSQATAEFVRSMFTASADSALVEKIVADMASAPPEVGLGALQASLDYMIEDQARALEEVGLPVRCINSDNYPTDVEAGRRHAPSFEVLYMPGLGHFVMNEDPQGFNRLLEQVLEELASSAAPGKK